MDTAIQKSSTENEVKFLVVLPRNLYNELGRMIHIRALAGKPITKRAVVEEALRRELARMTKKSEQAA